MKDRIVFPEEAIEDAIIRFRRIATALDDLSSMLRVAELCTGLECLRKAAVRDELTHYVKRLSQAAEEAQRIGKALSRASESFEECEAYTTKRILGVRTRVEEEWSHIGNYVSPDWYLKQDFT